MAEVVLKNLVKVYPGDRKNPPFKAVKGIDLHIREGEFMVLVGPSGCAKSTTLRMVAGLEDVTSGEIEIGGKMVNAIPPKDRDIAMVFQNYALYPHLSVRENMAFALVLKRMPAAEIDARVADAAGILGLDELLERKPKALSGGQRQRVALGRAIVRQPKVFLFDEPLSNLDAKMRVSMRTEIARLHARLKTTMIYVTHDQTEAMTLGDRVTIMESGELMQVGKPLEVYERPANRFVAGFVGSPPMNFFEGRLRKDGRSVLLETRRGSLALSGPGPSLVDRDVTLGLRPEHVELVEGSGDDTVAATVALSEPMGSETFLHLELSEGSPLTAKVAGHLDPDTGSVLRVRLPLKHARFFEPGERGAVIEPS